MTVERPDPVPRPGDAAADPRPTAGADPVGQLIDGRYRVARVIGQGGTGIVYKAVDERTQRDVAIKMLLDAALDSPEAVARFKREADVLLRIVHPNVLPVFDTGKHGGYPYLVLSYVAGKTLKELIPPGGFADTSRAVRLAVTLAETLHYVYDRHKVLHRDVKPANLMLADGDDSALYLMDFGLAYRDDPTQARLTANQSTLGTPAYMSPEQVHGRLNEIDHRTDVYSTGVTLYHMLTGKLPFVGTGFKLFSQITQTPPEPPSKHRPGLDPRLDRIVLKSLAKNPADRYPTCREFAAALSEWLASRSGGLRFPAARSALPVPYGRVENEPPTTVLTAVTPPSDLVRARAAGVNRVAVVVALLLLVGGLIVASAVAVWPSPAPAPTERRPAGSK
jgi:serine/threonine protein kinase